MFFALLYVFTISVDFNGQIDGCTQDNIISLKDRDMGVLFYYQQAPQTFTLSPETFVCIFGNIVISADSPFSAKYKLYKSSDEKFEDNETIATSPYAIKGDNSKTPLIKLYTETPGKEVKIQFVKVGPSCSVGSIYNMHSVFTTYTHFVGVFNYIYITKYSINVNALFMTVLSNYKVKISSESNDLVAKEVINPSSNDDVGNILGLHFVPEDLYAQSHDINTNFLITIEKNNSEITEGFEKMFNDDVFVLLPYETGHFSYQELLEFTKENKGNVFKDDPCIVTKYKLECIKITTPAYIPEEDNENGLSSGAIAGIVCGVLAAIAIIVILLWVFVFRKKSPTDDQQEP